MLAALPYALTLLMPPLVVFSARLGGNYTWIPVLFSFAMLPVLDLLAGLNARNPNAVEVEKTSWFKWITWLWVPLQVGLLIWLVAPRWFLPHLLLKPNLAEMTWSSWLGLVASTAVVTGAIGITYAHELVHRPSRFERVLGEILLATVSYTHFAVEHVYGHHKNVGTPHDPATARRGQGYWSFLARALVLTLVSAWRLESRRLQRRHGRVWHIDNKMVRYLVEQVCWYGLLYGAFGWVAVKFVAAQALAAVMHLAMVDYMQHYGLMRRELSPGIFEKIGAHHSWDSYFKLNNWVLINLARHSDHHLVASRRYQGLQTRDEAPQLPAGYATMVLLAVFPPLWKRVMDPRVDAWQAKYYPREEAELVLEPASVC